MSQPDELDELARRYVDLWQDQMTALAADPDFAEAMQRIMASLGVTAAGLPAAWSAWPAAMASMMAAAQPDRGSGVQGSAEGRETDVDRSGSSPGQGPDRSGGWNNGAGPSGAAPSASAPDGGGSDLDLLTQRLAALEQRIAALEGGSGRARGKPAAKPQSKPRAKAAKAPRSTKAPRSKKERD